jgi:2-phosphosulfolactate phosphatase
MNIERATLETCDLATGTVVVIDVLRAFTTAAYAFAAGAREIILVGGVAEAVGLRKCNAGLLLMGEVDGAPIPGFDFSNSPTALAGADLSGRRLVQRTSQGTQGVVRATRAAEILTASFVCAGATARYLGRVSPAAVTFVVTGAHKPGGGDEDAACADYIEALLRGTRPDPAPYLQRVRDSVAGRRFPDPGFSQYPAADLPYCLALDRFDFAMRVRRRGDLFLMGPVSPDLGSTRPKSG